MHELALAQDLVEAVERAVPDGRVLAVRLEVGPLAGVVPEALRFSFDVCAQGTRLEGAALDISETGIRGRCRTCGQASAFCAPIPLCPCGSADLALESGAELRVVALEVV